MLFVVTKMACGAQSDEEQIGSIASWFDESQTSLHRGSRELLKILIPGDVAQAIIFFTTSQIIAVSPTLKSSDIDDFIFKKLLLAYSEFRS